jgi:hypothetical protein
MYIYIYIYIYINNNNNNNNNNNIMFHDLCRNMFPLIYALSRKMPVIGDILSLFDSNDSAAGGRDSSSKQGNRKSNKRHSDDANFGSDNDSSPF